MGLEKIPEDNGSIYIREIPVWLRTRFKAACAMKGTSMRRVMIKFMKEYCGSYIPPVTLEPSNFGGKHRPVSRGRPRNRPKIGYEFHDEKMAKLRKKKK